MTMLKTLIALATALPLAGPDASAKPRRTVQDPTRIEHPHKIGVGTYPVEGAAMMVADVHRLGARWFYDWSPRSPAIEMRGWSFRLPATGTAQPSVRFRLATAAQAETLVCVDYLDKDRRLGSATYRLAGRMTEHEWRVDPPPGTSALRLFVSSPAGSRVTLGKSDYGDGSVSRPLPAPVPIRGLDGQQHFVPMIWGAVNAATLMAGASPAAGPALLTFNEPDLRKQANLSVETAIALWPTLMATGRRLSSPATTTGETLGPSSWLGQFMAQAHQKRYRVDFIAVHYYTQTPSIPAFRAFLEKVHAAYRRPIWITEWALADWRRTDRFSPEEQRAFFADAVQMLDDLPYVERHAWFGSYKGLDSWDIGAHLIDGDGALTPVGQAFRAAAATRNGWSEHCDPRSAGTSTQAADATR